MNAAARQRTTVLSTALVALLLITFSVVRVSSAGFTAQSGSGAGWETGRVVVTDDDAGSAMFATGNDGLLDGGASLTRCIAVEYSGTFTSNVLVRLHGTAAGALAPFLNLKIEEGTGGGSGTCAGFGATSTLYDGTLDGFATTYPDFANGASNWAPTSTPQTRTYRVTSTVQNLPAAQSKSATATLTWTAGPPPSFTPAALSNKALWLRAKDLPVGPATTWTDKARNEPFRSVGGIAPTVVDGATPSGGKAVRFPTSTQGQSFLNGTVPLNALVAESTSSQGGFTPAMAADGSIGTAWATANPTFPSPPYAGAKLQMTPRAGSTITGYSMTPWQTNQWRPSTWTLEGSDDKTTWTVIDTHTNTPVGAAGQTYTLATPATYANYRLNITAVDLGPIVAIAEISLTGSTKASAAEAWVVMRSRVGSGGTQGLWTSGNGLSHLVPYQGNQMVETFGIPSSGYRPIFFATKDLYQWRLYRITSDGTTWTADLDGARQFTISADYTNWGADSWNIGTGYELGYDGDVAEILIRGAVSTPQEVTKLVTYFNAEHGLSVPTS